MNEAIASLIDELERESRERSRSLEALGRLPYPFVEVHHPLTERERSNVYIREVFRAMLIARDLETCEALLQGESVPDERIDWEQARRFERLG